MLYTIYKYKYESEFSSPKLIWKNVSRSSLVGELTRLKDSSNTALKDWEDPFLLEIRKGKYSYIREIFALFNFQDYIFKKLSLDDLLNVVNNDLNNYKLLCEKELQSNHNHFGLYVLGRYAMCNVILSIVCSYKEAYEK